MCTGMRKNRSAPVDSLLPKIVYADIDEASRWLGEALAYSEHSRYGNLAAPEGAPRCASKMRG